MGTGPAHPAWVTAQIKEHRGPYFTCEAVLSEAFHLLEETRDGADRRLKTLKRGFLRLDFTANDHLPAPARLLRPYADLPMSWADACLVRMTELDDHGDVVTWTATFASTGRTAAKLFCLPGPESR